MASWFFQRDTGAWFKDVYDTQNHEPIAVCVFDGDSYDDRVLLLGSDDGYVRKVSTSEANDDGTAIEAYVTLGPLTSGTSPALPIVLVELMPVLDPNSATIFYETLAGDTPEAAMETEAVTFTGDGTFAASGRLTAHPRVSGYYIYVKVGETDVAAAWAFESIRARVQRINTAKGRLRPN